MRHWLPLATVLAISWTFSVPVAAGSIAERVQAATRVQQQESEKAGPTTWQHAAATAPHADAAPPTTPDSRGRGRINVADWLNAPRADEVDGAQVGAVESSPSEVAPPPQSPSSASEEPVHVASRRRSLTARPLPQQDPMPAPPQQPSATAPPPVELFDFTQDRDLSDESLQDKLSTLGEIPLQLEEPGNIAGLEEFLTEEVTEAGEDEATEESGSGEEHSAAEESAVDEEPAEADAADGDAKQVPADEKVAEEEEDDPAAIAPKREFSPQMLQLRDRIRGCLSYYYQRTENVAERSPWGIMHTLIAFGVDTELIAGRQRVNAIGWLAYNRECRGLRLMRYDGQFPVPQFGPGYQGHEGQLLSMLALSRVKSTYPMRVDGRDLTVQDLIEYEKYTCRPKTELTFKLIGLAHYLPSDATWRSKTGEEWSIPRLIQEELAQPINGATCGGTHRLIGFSMATKVRLRRGEPLDGQWARAHKFVDGYHKYAIRLQNPDGSFSTNWLKSRQDTGDTNRRIQTTGHILEWLVYSLPEQELTDPRIVRSANYLNTVLWNNRNQDLEIGPRGHALRALALYNERVFGDRPGERRALLARRPQK